MANATTTGFKRSESASSPFGEMLLHNMGMPDAPAVGTMELGAQVQGIDRIDSQGALRFTGNRLDLALIGSGNFTVDTPNGRRYTRDGSFGLDSDGRLVTKEGDHVLGAGGPITLGRGEVKIAADGTITQGGTVRGRLLLTDLAPESIATEQQPLHRHADGDAERAGASEPPREQHGQRGVGDGGPHPRHAGVRGQAEVRPRARRGPPGLDDESWRSRITDGPTASRP